VANVGLPDQMREMLDATNTVSRRMPQSVAELLEVRVRFALKQQHSGDAKYTLFPLPITDAAVAQEVRTVVRQLLSPDLAAGLRLDLTRPLGNGRDDNGNGVVDEPGEDAPVAANPPSYVWSQNMRNDFATALFKPLDAAGLSDSDRDGKLDN